MKLKQKPEDFIVDELFDLDALKIRDEERRPYYYFILKKTNYSQIRAIEKVAKILNTSRKLINFAGTKDKVSITTGLISVYNLKEDNLQKNIDFLNSEVDDLELEYLGKFKSRIGLGDNIGNKFKITIRDLDENDIKKAKENINVIHKNGILNLFDEQRFGYANNSHIVGKYVLQNDINSALKEVITSCPEKPSEDLRIYTTFIKENWEEIVKQNPNILEEIKKIIPKFLSSDLDSINHLYKYKNDFPGAFKKINKKIRTLYINAYQSYLFNTAIQNTDLDKLPEEIELYNYETIYEDKNIEQLVNNLLKKDNLTQENFKLKSMPELKLKPNKRKTKIYPKDIKIIETSIDELADENQINKQKLIIKFKLGSGEYATNVVKQLLK